MPGAHAAYLEDADAWSRSWCYRGGVRVAFASAVHAHAELALVEEGEVAYRVGRRVMSVGAGQLAWIPGGCEHATSFAARVLARVIAVPDEALSGALGEPRSWSRQPGVQALVRLLADALRRRSPAGRLEAEALRDAIVARLAALAGQPAPAPLHGPVLRRVVDAIHANLDEPWSVDALAAMAGMSRFHFSRAFRRAAGMSPYQYLLAARLEAAAALVPVAAMGVAEIGLACGFSDASRFAQMFKRRWGVTPQALRAAVTSARAPRA